MAAAALVAGAGKNISVDSKAIAATLGETDALRVFDLPLATGLFNRFAEQIRGEPERGRAVALKTAAGVAGSPADAEFVVRVGAALGRGEGGLSAAQGAGITELSAALGVAHRDLWAGPLIDLDAGDRRPLIITIGNEKGGTGKSTIAMHLVVALLKLGYSVGSIDLDGHQGTLSRYIENRGTFGETTAQAIRMPHHRRIETSKADQRETAEQEEKARLREALLEVTDRQVVVIDTPGGDSTLSRLAHANADMVITPLNDTFLDMDVLAEIDRVKREVRAPSIYCKMVLEQNDHRILSDREPIHWIVMRNRLTHVDSHSKREIIDLLKQLAARLDFRLVNGFGERVIFHELFLSGLTLLDLPDEPARDRNYLSHHRACQEFRGLLLEIGAMV